MVLQCDQSEKDKDRNMENGWGKGEIQKKEHTHTYMKRVNMQRIETSNAII